MRAIVLSLVLATTASAEDLQITVLPEAVFVENIGGTVVPLDRVFFHVILHNISKEAIEVRWARIDLVGSDGASVSCLYFGKALQNLFNSSIDRRRIEPTEKSTTTLPPDARKAITDVFLQLPSGFVGDTLVIESEYQMRGTSKLQKTTTPLRREVTFRGRLPFEGIWYVLEEHGPVDAHKRFTSEGFAYDFLQIGNSGRSFTNTGARNSDYPAFGKKVLAARDGVVVYLRDDIPDNTPGTPRTDVAPGNVVILDHGGNAYSYYAHLREKSVSVSVGDRIRAGDPIAEVGNSGDSLEPQLHFHVMNGTDPSKAQGLPVVFENWQAQSFGRQPTERRTGVIPKGEFVQP